MKNVFTIMLILIVLTAFSQSRFKIETADSISNFTTTMPKVDWYIGYDCFKPAIRINFIKGKPFAEKPYCVFIRNHSLIIFKNGRKIGAFKYYKKPFQLTNLKLN